MLCSASALSLWSKVGSFKGRHQQASLFTSMHQSDLPIVSDELYIMSLVTLLDTIHANGVAVCCVTSVTPMETQGVFFFKQSQTKISEVIFEYER